MSILPMGMQILPLFLLTYKKDHLPEFDSLFDLLERSSFSLP